ncbi:odorant receptor 85c-like [Scaptodrosophila lebanonensis]|uniref:Odorant receptor 85c-like n=1 Tax=Drosophila lebanonensis TaxID=7225 RepID=A0A6J2TL92_DROLE|nr:odorant receptor 85c-like [Scaptodrosophila lebanonensis]
MGRCTCPMSQPRVYTLSNIDFVLAGMLKLLFVRHKKPKLRHFMHELEQLFVRRHINMPPYKMRKIREEKHMVPCINLKACNESEQLITTTRTTYRSFVSAQDESRKARKMPQTKIDSFMKYANFFYKCVGIEPYRKISRPAEYSAWLNIVYWANIINLLLIMLAEIVYVLIAFATGEHIVEAIMTMSYIGFVIVGIAKMLVVWWKKSALSEFMHVLEQLYPSTVAEQQDYRLQRYQSFCAWVSIGFATLYSVLIWTYNLFGIMQYLLYERLLQTRVVDQTLPYFMYIPWENYDNWSYYLLFFMQNFAGYTSAAGQISTDLLLCAVASQLIMHYDYLARQIEQKKLKGCWQQNSEFLIHTVRYHERLLSLSARINHIFGVPLLLNFLVSSFVICFVGFQMTVGVSLDTMIKLTLFLVSSMCQVYLICHYGQLVEDASFGISKAVYKQQWLDADVRYKKSIALIIKRAQKPAFLKATVFMQINRGSMTDLLQLSYKFFALLRTMYNK